ncbi:Fur-regulated basic protein FbpA [Fictibacillus nanhaiensis]|uniref:Fur-regulated basic protein FbpA n=1 Tax=Fictibacillus nanhaiensis TaxID=742169 RepID=UPI002E222FED|nr:Fur-regulated basic protein FbpA [Fictibacillus nanhaiensis]
MKVDLQNDLQNKKDYLISSLLLKGIYKKEDIHLYELSVAELEEFTYTLQFEREKSHEKEKFKTINDRK